MQRIDSRCDQSIATMVGVRRPYGDLTGDTSVTKPRIHASLIKSIGPRRSMLTSHFTYMSRLPFMIQCKQLICGITTTAR